VGRWRTGLASVALIAAGGCNQILGIEGARLGCLSDDDCAGNESCGTLSVCAPLMAAEDRSPGPGSSEPSTSDAGAAPNTVTDAGDAGGAGDACAASPLRCDDCPSRERDASTCDGPRR
jgi:hypothetical protein